MSHIHRADNAGRIDYILAYRALSIMVRRMEHDISCNMDVDDYKRRKDTVMIDRYVRMCDHPEIQKPYRDKYEENGGNFTMAMYLDNFNEYTTNADGDTVWLPRIEDWITLCKYDDDSWHEFLDDLLIMRRVTHEAKQERITIHEACALVFMNDHAYIWDDEKGWVK